MSEWFRSLGPEEPSALASARRDVQWAMQVAASAGAALPSEPFDAQSCLTWSSPRALLEGRAQPNSGARAALRVPDLTILVLDDGGAEHGAFPLDGNTLEEGIAWLGRALGEREGRDVACARPEGIIPFHPVARGGLFLLTDREPLLQLARWLDSAHAVLTDLRGAHADASPLQMWPTGPYYAFGTGPDDQPTTTSLGMCLGDRTFSAPYFFVKAPKGKENASYDGPGLWMRMAGFAGAVLPGADVVAAGDAAEQEKAVRAFFSAAVAATS